MAVYTHISPDELARFLERYDLGELVSYDGILSGIENTNYMVETTRNRYILTLFEKRTDPADLPYFMAVKRHLSAKGFPCPEPQPDRKGNVLSTLSGQPATIVSFLEGSEPGTISSAHCYATGRALARAHLALGDFTLTRANALDVTAWPRMWQQSRADADALMPGLSDLIDADMAVLIKHWPQAGSLPTGTIHCDLFPDNALFIGEEFTGAIDFYFACTDFLAYDLAICLNAWAFSQNGTFLPDRSSALIDGYQSIRTLELSELVALPLLARGAAMRFFLTRLFDWSHA